MTARSTGPYQSRLFNQVNRQVLRWGDRLEKAVRHFKVAAEWSLQILLYPVYLFLHPEAFGDRQLQQTAETRKPLTASNDSDSSVEQAENLPTAAPAGILADLDRQVAELEKQRLIGALGNYWGKLGARLGGSKHERSLQVNQRPLQPWQILNLIRAAITYFFGDRQQSTVEGTALSTQVEPSQNKQLESQADNQKLVPFRSVIVFTQQQKIRSFFKFPQTFGVPAQALRQLPLTLWTRFNPLPTASQTVDSDPFHISLLIRAAIDYFFGNRQQATIRGTSAAIAAATAPSEMLSGKDALHLPSQPSGHPPKAVEDPWLSWKDLYGETSSEKEGQLKHTAASVVSEPVRLKAAKTPSKPNHSPWERLKNRLRQGKLSQLQMQQSLGAAEPQHAEETQLQFTPLWVEAEATPIGYVKHPLEIALEWLDRLILWLEELAMSLWNWLLEQILNFQK